MSCKACGSDLHKNFNGEIAIHFAGLQGLEMPIVWVFPKLLVCPSCGSAEFQIPEEEMRILKSDDAAAPASA